MRGKVSPGLQFPWEPRVRGFGRACVVWCLGLLLALVSASGVHAAGYALSITTAYPQLAIASTAPQVGWYSGNCGNTLATANAYKLCDDGVSPVMALGFSFTFGGITYNNWSMSSNGVIFFETGAPGTGSTGGTSYTPNNLPTTTFGADKPALMPFWADLYKNASATGVLDANSASQPANASFIQYQTVAVGSAKVLVIQLRNVGYYNATGTLVNMQVQIWSTGQIVYAYGAIGVVASSPNLRIGLQYVGSCYTLANNQSASLSSQSYLYLWDPAAPACPSMPTVDHYEIRHDGAATMCAEPVTVLACSTSAKPCPAANIVKTQIINASVLSTGSGSLATPNISPKSFNLLPSAPQQTVNLTWASGSSGTATLGLQAAVKPTTAAATCTNVGGTSAYANCSIPVSNAACVPPPHHFEIQGPAGSTVCSNSTFAIKAWADAAQTTPYTSGWSGTLTQSGNAASVPNLGSFTIAAGTSSVNITPITFPSAGTTTFSTTSATALVGSTTCKFGASTSCAHPVVGCAPPAPTGLNAVNTGANAVSGKITTKTAGTAFALDVYALNATRTAHDNTAGGDVLIDLLANATIGTGLDANNCPTSGSSIGVGTVTLAAGLASAVPFPAIGDAWRDVRVRMRYPATGTATLTACSTDNFAVKPSYLSAAASDMNAASAGTDRILNATTATGSPTHKAGRPFTLRMTAYNANNAITSQYSGTPTATTACVLPATGCGSLSAGAFSASAGTLISNTASYNEVGAISASFADTGFASVDSADTAASCAGYHVCSSAIGIGRFTPDHFALTPGTLTQGCGAFTYFGQEFTTGFLLTAQNSANTTTQNYTGSLARLGLTAWANFGFSAASASLIGGQSAPSGTWVNGTAAITATHKAVRALSGTPNAATDLGVTAQPVDADGIALSATAVIATSPHRFGRLYMADAVGSEHLTLSVPLSAQHWNGTDFVTNTLDNCTTLATPALTYYAQTASNRLASGETAATVSSPLVAGIGSLVLGVPGVGNHGYLDATVSAPAWLQYNWDGIDQGADSNLFDDNPRARATFGKRKISDKIIFRREMH